MVILWMLIAAVTGLGVFYFNYDNPSLLVVIIVVTLLGAMCFISVLMILVNLTLIIWSMRRDNV